MEINTIEQLEKMREDARALDSQSKSLPVLLSITLIPILFGCAFVAFPEDARGILLLGKLWIAGIIVGLMVCSYLSAALAQATNFRKYWPSLLCGLIVAVPPTIATISSAAFGLPLVQWSVTVGVISCSIGLYLYLKKTGENKTKFTVHFVHSFFALLVLYAQLQAGLAVAYNFPLSPAGQVVVCAFYPLFAALFRRVCVLLVPLSGSLTSEIFSIYFASMTFRILTIYYASWGVLFAVLFVEILSKFTFYTVQLSDKYITVWKRAQAGTRRMWLCLPPQLHKFTDLEAEDTEELLPIPRESEKAKLHKDISFLFFLQTHADMYLGLGLVLVQLTVIKIVGSSPHDCFSDYFSDFMSVTWKFSVIAGVHIAFLILFYLFAAKVVGKQNFSPVFEATTRISQHHVQILLTNVALFLLVFLLFFKSYNNETSSYCPINNN